MNIVTLGINFATAVTRWQLAGKPLRLPSAIVTLYNRCKTNQCGKYQEETPISGHCLACGCPLSREQSTWNKIALATEDCPLGMWNPTEPHHREVIKSSCCNG